MSSLWWEDGLDGVEAYILTSCEAILALLTLDEECGLTSAITTVVPVVVCRKKISWQLGFFWEGT